MWKDDKQHFENIRKNCGGCRFTAINYVTKTARSHIDSIEPDECISDYDAIQWALTCTRPNIRKKKIRYKLDEDMSQEQYLNEILCYVDDEEICEAVRETYECSNKLRHLIYVYNSIYDDDRKARVRILSNMVWYYK